MLKVFFHIPCVYTDSSFYRAFKAGIVRGTFDAYRGRLLTLDGFVCVIEMLVKMSRLPIRIVEVPMVLYFDRRMETSKMKKFEAILGYLKLIWREMLRDRNYNKKALEKYYKAKTIQFSQVLAINGMNLP